MKGQQGCPQHHAVPWMARRYGPAERRPTDLAADRRTAPASPTDPPPTVVGRAVGGAAEGAMGRARQVLGPASTAAARARRHAAA